MFAVYLISCAQTGLEYVGQTNAASTRWPAHKWEAKRGNPAPLYADMRRLGNDAFAFEVLCFCANRFDADRIEWLEINNRSCVYPRGYNRGPGGRSAAAVATRKANNDVLWQARGCRTEEDKQKWQSAKYAERVRESAELQARRRATRHKHASKPEVKIRRTARQKERRARQKLVDAGLSTLLTSACVVNSASEQAPQKDTRMAKYIVEADSLAELTEALAEITGIDLQEITGGEVSGAALAAGAAAAGGEAAPAKRTRKRNATAAAPDPVQPGAAGADAAAGVAAVAGAAGAAAGSFSPTGPGPGAAGPGAFNPAGAAGGFNPGAGAAVQESAQLVTTRNLIDQMAAQHGAANVFNWVKQVLGAAIDQNIPAEQVRDAILPKLSDAQLLDIYTKAGGK